MSDPVPWTEIRDGWIVLTSDGHRLGTVVQADGHREHDRLVGLAFETGEPAEIRYVGADRIERIGSGEVILSVTDEDAAALKPFPVRRSDTELLAGRTRAQRIWNWLRS